MAQGYKEWTEPPHIPNAGPQEDIKARLSHQSPAHSGMKIIQSEDVTLSLQTAPLVNGTPQTSVFC
jgi:hypothetical protein